MEYSYIYNIMHIIIYNISCSLIVYGIYNAVKSCILEFDYFTMYCMAGAGEACIALARTLFIHWMID
jgi:hypothetical protein